MKQRTAVVAVVSFAAGTLWGQADPGIKFIGRGAIPGNQADKSGLKGSICQLGNPANCIPSTTLGGLGSGIAYTGFDNLFLAAPDRGPFDGRTNVPYLDRFHYLRLNVDTTKNPNTGVLNISWNLAATLLLRNEVFRNLVGASSAFSLVSPLANLRFDPEGVVVTPWGTFIISDEYGPYIYEFTGLGYLLRRHRVPAKFLIDNPTGDVNTPGDSLELYKFSFMSGLKTYGNNSGRQANRGMEGLAITPDGRYLVGIMQNALIQDNGLSYTDPQTLATSPARAGLNNRILKYDPFTGRSSEYVYVMDSISQGRGVNEILAINDHEFLVLERDNRSFVSPGASPFTNQGLKRIYKIDLNKPGLTDVSGYNSLPASFVPVTKVLFLDLLNPAYVVNASTTPPTTIKDVVAEKMEGMARGPDLPNGHHLLYVLSDNDLNTGFPTQIYAFEVDPSPSGANINFARQLTLASLFSHLREIFSK